MVVQDVGFNVVRVVRVVVLSCRGISHSLSLEQLLVPTLVPQGDVRQEILQVGKLLLLESYSLRVLEWQVHCGQVKGGWIVHCRTSFLLGTGAWRPDLPGGNDLLPLANVLLAAIPLRL